VLRTAEVTAWNVEGADAPLQCIRMGAGLEAIRKRADVMPRSRAPVDEDWGVGSMGRGQRLAALDVDHLDALLKGAPPPKDG